MYQPVAVFDEDVTLCSSHIAEKLDFNKDKQE